MFVLGTTVREQVLGIRPISVTGAIRSAGLAGIAATTAFWPTREAFDGPSCIAQSSSDEFAPHPSVFFLQLLPGPVAFS